jgi:translation initiation factor IF-2
VTVKELAEKMDVKAKDIIRLLMMRGVMVTVNVALEPDLAKTIAAEFGFAPEVVSFEEDLRAAEEEQIFETEDFEGEEESRPPVVTVMGHVDHGKTSLLDAIRKSNVAAGEAGGITQSIGAYQVEINGRKITFIDTPGHEAFTSMRARGAQITDIVVLVVAATDSVMPQTIEAINHAKAAGVPVIVAINKIDLPNARPDKTKTDLMAHGIVAEDFGGDTVTIGVSARTGANVEQLLELITLTADMRNLKSSVKRRAQGTVIEAGIDRGMGPFANIIVQEGTIKPGDPIIVGAEWGRVRALLDAQGGRVDIAGPSTPVRVTGIQGVPNAGDRIQVVESEARAREISDFRMHKRREAELAKSGSRGTLQDLSKAIAEGETKELAIVVKADVHGALEVLTKTLAELSTSKVKTKIIHAGTGAITDSDVLLASASRAVIIGFNVRPERGAAELAEREKVVVRLHTIIYELVNEMKLTMAGLLDSVKEEEFLGRAEVRQIFKVSRVGTVAGCIVQDGKMVRTAEVRLVRDGAIIWSGRLGTLKRFKDDVREVAAGFECGLSLDGFNDVKVGDTIEAYTIKEIRPTSLE